MKLCRNNSLRSQRGSVLVMSMMMLLVLTLIGVTAMQLSNRQEKLSGNTRSLDLAFQAAEAAVRGGESALALATLPDPISRPEWYYDMEAPRRAPYLGHPDGWEDANLDAYDQLPVDLGAWGVAAAPLMAIAIGRPVQDYEEGAIDGEMPSLKHVYRVHSLGTGGGESTNVILQSTFVRR